MDLQGARIGGGLFRIRDGKVSFADENKLALTNVSLNVEIADTVALFEVRQTFNNAGETCDACAAYPLLNFGGGQFSVTFSVNNVATSPAPMKEKVPYSVTSSPDSHEQLCAKLYNACIANIPAGKNVVVHITYTKPLVFRGNTARLHIPLSVMNIEETADSKVLKKRAKSWTAIVSCIFRIHMMSNIVSITSPSDKIDASLSAAKPNEALVQFQRAAPVSPIDLVITVADASASHVYFSPLDLKPDEKQGLHHASVALLGMTVPTLKFSHMALPEVIFLLDVSESMKETPFKFLTKSLQYLLKKLPDDAPFNIVTFGKGHAELMWPKSQLRSKKTVAAAGKFIDKCKAVGTDSNVLAGLQAAVSAPVFEGFARQVVVLTDGMMNLGLSDLEKFLDAAKQRLLRIFCIGHGPASLRFCSRLSSVGRGQYVVAEPWETEKLFKPSLDKVLASLMQPPTTLTNLELKACSMIDALLDRTMLDACYEGQRVNVFCALPPGVSKISGEISLFLGEGSCKVKLDDQSLAVWDGHHPMADVLQRMCAHYFMEELMEGRPFNNERVSRRKAQADFAAIESRWTTSIVSPDSSVVHSTRNPGQVKMRPAQEKSGAVSSSGGSSSSPATKKAREGLVSSKQSAAVRAQAQDAAARFSMQRTGMSGLPPTTWPRPREGSSMTEENVAKAKDMMIRMRPKKSIVLEQKDQLYRFEAEAQAQSMCLAYVSSKMKVPPEQFSRATQKMVTKATAAALLKYESFFSVSLRQESDNLADASLAPKSELESLVRDAVDALRPGTSSDKTASSDMELMCSSSFPALISCYGDIGGRPKGMEDRHVCLPNFYTLSRLSTFDNDSIFCAVYDGHAGPMCAEFCRIQLHVNLVAQYRVKQDWLAALPAAFHETDNQFRALADVRRLNDGTTASVVLIEESTLYWANVGDGEGFLRWKSGKIERVAEPHKSSDPSELKRMREVEERRQIRCVADLGTGGVVVTDPDGNYVRVARSIGDAKFDAEIVTCEPAVGKIQLNEDVDFVVIASDGIWDVINYEEAADMLSYLSGSHQVKAAETLVKEAIKRGSMDNCTAVVVFLRPSSLSTLRN